MADQHVYNAGVVNEYIAEAIRRPGWSQARLARALSVRPQTVNKWVKGENTPPPTRWESIEEALGFAQGTFYLAAMGSDAVAEGLMPRRATVLVDQLEHLERRFAGLEAEVSEGLTELRRLLVSLRQEGAGGAPE